MFVLLHFLVDPSHNAAIIFPVNEGFVSIPLQGLEWIVLGQTRSSRETGSAHKIPPGQPRNQKSQSVNGAITVADEEKESSSERIKAAVLVEAIFSSPAHEAGVLASPACQTESHHGEDVHYSLVLGFP